MKVTSINTLFKIIDFASVLSDRLGKAINMDKLDSVSIPSGRILPLVSELHSAMEGTANNSSFSPTFNITVAYDSNSDEESARRFGKNIGDGAIQRLNEAAGRRGMGTLAGAGLRS